MEGISIGHGVSITIIRGHGYYLYLFNKFLPYLEVLIIILLLVLIGKKYLNKF